MRKGRERRSTKKAIAMTALAGPIAMVAGCSSGQLPVGAELSMTPSDKTIEITEFHDAQDRCIGNDDYFVDIPVVLRLTTAGGSPIGDASVDVYVDFAENTFAGRAPLALYEDRNGNGVVDADSELVSGADDDIARVRTDEETGTKTMLLRILLACAFRGEVFAYADGFTASTSIGIEALEVVRVAPPETEPADTDPPVDEETLPVGPTASSGSMTSGANA